MENAHCLRNTLPLLSHLVAIKVAVTFLLLPKVYTYMHVKVVADGELPSIFLGKASYGDYGQYMFIYGIHGYRNSVATGPSL